MFVFRLFRVCLVGRGGTHTQHAHSTGNANQVKNLLDIVIIITSIIFSNTVIFIPSVHDIVYILRKKKRENNRGLLLFVVFFLFSRCDVNGNRKRKSRGRLTKALPPDARTARL